MIIYPYPSGWDTRQQVAHCEVDEWPREDVAVEAVENAAMSGKQIPEILAAFPRSAES